MPNHITNIITASPRVISTLHGSENAPVDFNRVIPMPDELVGISANQYECLARLLVGALKPAALDGTLASAIHSLTLRSAEDQLARLLHSQGKSARLFLTLWGTVDPESPETEETLRSAFCHSEPGAMRPEDFDNLMRMIRGYKKHGFFTWYDWSVENWGTKWNAYDASISPAGDQAIFDTAWSTPLPVFTRLSEMYPDEDIRVKYADEDLGHNCGHLLFREGQYTEFEIGDPVDFACQIKGSNPEEYGYQRDPETGLYAYVDEEDEESEES